MSGLSNRYVAMRDFQATSEDEISIKVKERVQVLFMERDRWRVSKVDLSGQVLDPPEGYVPRDCLVNEMPVEQQQWFMDIDKAETEKLLLSEPNIDGSFLVRPGRDLSYCLSVRKNKQVIHYDIERDVTQGFFIHIGRYFTCVHDLVLYHRYHLEDHKCLPLVPFLSSLSSSENWERPSSDFTLVRKVSDFDISHYRFTRWESSWKEGRRKVLVHTMSREFFTRNHFMSGMEVLKTLSHRNVAELYALCTTEDPVYIVTECMEKGDLQSFLCGEEGHRLSESELLHIADQVLVGMAYLEAKRVLHLDLCCRNILVGNDLVCKISQFGFAIQEKGKHVWPPGKKMLVKWMPPEVIEQGEVSSKTDVWSFGILLYEIFSLGQTPYKGVTSKEAAKNMLAGYRLPMPPLCPADVYDLMLKCWYEDPRKRPTFQQIVESKIFF
ncbi:tyrosine-protein kinase Srms-like [Hyperolius riggenbachi]|uniref:tyrosine-protein kinase Srms-like n=1 Tax=Hyperolius riggenbachi TaxID=752182 RepID=UPI0035A3BC22